ncbi:MAG: type pilus assembly protein PilA [Verrucomicrobiota bacterium]
MKLKLLLPWLCVVGLVICLVALYSDSQKQAADLAKAKQDSQELEQLRAAAEEAKKVPTESEEMARLRKENDELLRLRNDVRQLRLDKAQLTRQVEVAQGQVQSAQAQVQFQAQRLSAAQTAAASAAEQQAVAARNAMAQTAACINNLRQIDGAKQQWALENKKTAEDVPPATELALFFKGGAFPVCPAGGAYTINAVGVEATCSIPGHVLPK